MSGSPRFPSLSPLIPFEKPFLGLHRFGPGHPVGRNPFIMSDGKDGFSKESHDECERSDHQVVGQRKNKRGEQSANQVGRLHPDVVYRCELGRRNQEPHTQKSEKGKETGGYRLCAPKSQAAEQTEDDSPREAEPADPPGVSRGRGHSANPSPLSRGAVPP